MHRTYASVLAIVCGITYAAGGKAEAASYQVLYAVQGGSDGANPVASLLNVGGTLYGTTYGGGASSDGTVFSLNLTTGAEKVVHSFHGSSDGSEPQASLIKVGTKLYGTTDQGGGSAACSSGGVAYGCGTVFSLNPTTGAEKVLHAFQNGNDGAGPRAGLLNVGDTLYGTTFVGGGGDTGYGSGTVFSLNLATGAEKVIAAGLGFDGYGGPVGGLINVGGALYGTTSSAGPLDSTVFSLNLATGDYKTVYSFRDQFSSLSTNLLKVGTELYGTTAGFDGTTGTVFSLSLTTGAEKLVYTFQSVFPNSTNGSSLIKVGALLYGTTDVGGASDAGTVFSLNPTTGAETVLHSFSGGSDGAVPDASLINVGGTLYGTTEAGGAKNFGTVFALTP